MNSLQIQRRLAIKQINLVFATLTMIFVACTQGVTPAHSGSLEKLGAALDHSLDVQKTKAAQVAVNYYFYTEVTPKLRACWDRVQGEGTIAMALTYKKSDGRWLFESVEPIRSSVPKEQAAVALQCMQDSARDTSFVLKERDFMPGERDTAKTFEKLVLKWTWLIPLPAKGSELMARPVGDGLGIDYCVTCIANWPARCEWVETGGANSCEVIGPSACAEGPLACLSGMYGKAGDSIIIF